MPSVPTDRRDQVSSLYHAALTRAPEERAAFLIEACGGDQALREEVESLLEFDQPSARLLERPAVAVAAVAMGATSMIDRQLGPYTIVAPLGAGGMGEVYRARDSKLGRDVAIKILPAHFTADAERRARFAREARTLATLNHPHIGAIYGLEESDGIAALVLELVEGPTLADRLERAPLPLAVALAIARQIIEALEAAHEKGIVHRDLKPANIVLQGAPDRLSSDVRVKVLDFGLAKSMAPDVGADPTLPAGSFDGTADGRILGTPVYMSPEQARGQTVDKRTDIWAFGCILFEMLTGRRAFEGETISDTFVCILERDPDWDVLPRETPAAVRTLLRRCLRKDPQKRLHDIADAILEIDDATTNAPGTTGAGGIASSGRLRSRAAVLPWLTATVLAAALAWVGSLYYRAARALPTEPAQLAIHPPEGVEFPAPPNFALSPDGRHLAFAPQLGDHRMLWVKSLVTGEAKVLPLTEVAAGPFWKPNSQEIGFFQNNQLMTVALSGGAPVVVADVGPFLFAAWNRADTILVSRGPLGIWKVRATGGTLEAATVLGTGDIGHRSGTFLPDGVHFLYTAQVGPERLELRVGSLESKEFVESLGPVESNAVYAGGYLFFVRGGHTGGGNLTAQAFDPERRRPIGQPVALGLQACIDPLFQYGGFSVSAESNRLVYLPRGTLFELTWRNREGTRVGTIGEPGRYFHVDLSPDDSSLAVARQTQEPGKRFQIDIWTIDLSPGGIFKRVTDDPAFEADPAWSGDGRQLAFNSNRPDRSPMKFALFVRPLNAGADIAIAQPRTPPITSPDWSMDNKHIIYADGGDLWTVSMAGDRKPSEFLKTKYQERQPTFSPDGRWIAYSSDSSGREEVYIRPFPRGETVHPVSRTGGWAPRWRHDGKELFFVGGGARLMAVNVDPAKGTTVGVPHELFRTGFRPENNRPFDVTRDGQRFVIPTIRPNDDVRVVLNWRALLPK